VVGDAGVLVPVRDVSALTDAIKALLEDAPRRVELGERGRKRIDELFCWRVTARRMSDYYLQVLQYANR
jgi:glycosyltransferase involved in cell wall biosynthesis